MAADVLMLGLGFSKSVFQNSIWSPAFRRPGAKTA